MDSCQHSWITRLKPVPPTVEEIKNQIKLNHTPVTREAYDVCIRCGIKRDEVE